METLIRLLRVLAVIATIPITLVLIPTDGVIGIAYYVWKGKDYMLDFNPLHMAFVGWVLGNGWHWREE